jgi:hypothetical protein
LIFGNDAKALKCRNCKDNEIREWLHAETAGYRLALSPARRDSLDSVASAISVHRRPNASLDKKDEEEGIDGFLPLVDFSGGPFTGVILNPLRY